MRVRCSHRVAQGALIGCGPGAAAALKVAQVLLGHAGGFSLVLHNDVDHAIGLLHADGTDLFGRERPQAPAFDHGRSCHADGGVLRGDDHVTTTGQRGIARKAAAIDDGHRGHQPAQSGQPQERHVVQQADPGVFIIGATAAPSAHSTRGNWRCKARCSMRSVFLWLTTPWVPAKTV